MYDLIGLIKDSQGTRSLSRFLMLFYEITRISVKVINSYGEIVYQTPNPGEARFPCHVTDYTTFRSFNSCRWIRRGFCRCC
ncbi:MAG: hypothetical protein SCK70_17465 [bacterium]|nr:hypothetical protein [bacterium]